MTYHPVPPRPARPRGPWYWPTRVLAVAAVVILGTSVALGIYLRRSGGDGERREPCATPVAPLSTPTVPAGQGGLSVTEQGFSVTDDGMIAIGGIVTNSGKQAAYRTKLMFRAFLPDGTSVPTEGSAWAPYFRQEIPVVPPGQRVVVGAIANVRTSIRQSTISRVEIELGATRLVPPDRANPLFRPVTTEFAQPMSRTRTTAERAEARYYVNGGCPGLASRGVAMVLRDAAGAIVGGNLDTGRRPGRCDGGENIQTTDLQAVPATADLTKTQLSVYCDVANAPLEADPSGTPVN